MKALPLQLFIIIVSLSILSSCVILDNNGNLALTAPLNEVGDTQVKILDAKGKVIHQSATPTMATMQPSDQYADKTGYSVIFTTPGYIERSFTIHSSREGSYFENHPNVRPMGVLVLNSKTGALFQINRENIRKEATATTATDHQNDFEIYTLNQLPEQWKPLLYPLN